MPLMIGVTDARHADLAPGCAAVRVGALAALIAEPPAEPARIALDCLFALPAFLPVARGDAGAARAWLQENAAAVESALRLLAGRCELVLTLDLPDETPASDARTGRDWLRARLAAERAGASATTHATTRLRAIAATAGHAGPTESAALRRDGRAGAELSLLAPLDGHRALADRLLDAARAELGDAPQARLRLSGPWPAYGFAAQAMAKCAEATPA